MNSLFWLIWSVEIIFLSLTCLKKKSDTQSHSIFPSREGLVTSYFIVLIYAVLEEEPVHR